MKDVAEQAGVSSITAWRALNEPEKVSEKTLKKVQKAVDEIGYVVNSAARSLVSATSGVVGVIVPTLYDSIFADKVQGISDVLDKRGIELLIGLSGYSFEKETELIRAFVGRQIDGLIITGREHNDRAFTILRRLKIPIVETWDYGSECLDMMVGFSNFDLAASSAQFLINQGYKRIAFVGAMSHARAVERRDGFLQTLEKAGLRPDPDLIIDVEVSLSGGAEAFTQLMNLSRPPEAIFFNGDTLAIAAHLEGTAKGYSFPKDVAIMGVHNSGITNYLRPALTSVYIPRYEMGREAALALCARLENVDYKVSKDLGFEIIERQTT